MSHVRPILPTGAPSTLVLGAPPPVAAAIGPFAAPGATSLEGKVQNALNLYLPLKTPAQMPEVLGLLLQRQAAIYAALQSLRYVHFARFLPSPDFTTLWTITTYDGGLDAYIMDFVAVLGDEFTAVLRYVRGAPPLPVQSYPREFVAFVRSHNMPIGVWSAYPELTALEIITGTGP
jgi:hypothetical protein